MPKELVVPDLMDGLISAPELSQEIAKLGTWLLAQDVVALRDLPISALGALAAYVKDRVHADRCERFVQSSLETRPEVSSSPPGKYYPSPMPAGVEDEEVVNSLLAERIAPSSKVSIPDNLWQTAPEAQPVPEFDIPRPAV